MADVHLLYRVSNLSIGVLWRGGKNWFSKGSRFDIEEIEHLKLNIKTIESQDLKTCIRLKN